MKLLAKVESEAGQTSVTPLLGRSFIQGRFTKVNDSAQFGPLLEVKSSVIRSFFVVAPNIDQSVVLNGNQPAKMDFIWTATEPFEKFLLIINSKSLKAPLKFELTGDKRDYSFLLDQGGTYQWLLQAISKDRSLRPIQQSGRFDLVSVTKDWFSIERIEPRERVFTSYGQLSSLFLKWRLVNDRKEEVDPSSEETNSNSLIYQVEVSSKGSGEVRRFSIDKQELKLPRIDAGDVTIRIQAYSKTGIERSHPLEFGIKIKEADSPRWPAGIENSLTLKEIRPGTFKALWDAPSMPAQYLVTLKRDGQVLEAFETSEKQHLLKRLAPGRYRFEVVARGLKGEYELSPLIEVWTVQSDSTIKAPRLKKIEVLQ